MAADSGPRPLKIQSRILVSQLRFSGVSTRSLVSRFFMSVFVPIFQKSSFSHKQSRHPHLPRNLMQAARHLG